jgi:hypothetical protein
MQTQKKIGLLLPKNINPDIANAIFNLLEARKDLKIIHAEEQDFLIFPRQNQHSVKISESILSSLLRYLPLIIKEPRTKLRLYLINRNSNIMKASVLGLIKRAILSTKLIFNIGISYDSALKITKFFSKTNKSKNVPDLDYLIYVPTSNYDAKILAHYVSMRTKIYCWLYSWDNLFKATDIYTQSDQFIVWNKELAKNLSNLYGIETKRISISSPPQFAYTIEFHNNEEKYLDIEDKSESNDSPYILYICSQGHPILAKVEVDMILNIYDTLHTEGIQLRFLVRTYPNSSYNYVQKTDIGNRNIHFSEIKSAANQTIESIRRISKQKYTQIKSAIAVINFGSTMILEAAHINPNIIQLGYIPISTNANLLRDQLKNEHIKNFLISQQNPALVSNQAELLFKINEILKNQQNNFDSSSYFKSLTKSTDGENFGEELTNLIISI